MALYYDGVFDTVANYLAALAAFGTANGWTVSVNTSTTVTMSKNGVTFTTAYNAATSVTRSVTVSGVSSGNLVDQAFTVGKRYRFISCGNDLFFFREYTYSTTTAWFVGGVFTITDKVGAWSGGTVLALGYSSGPTYTSTTFGQQMFYRSILFKDGAWTTYGTAAATGRLWGSMGMEWGFVDPNYFNAVVIPCPIMLGLYGSDTAYIHPLGMIPGVYRCGNGNVYNVNNFETIAINGATYMFQDAYNLLFKIS